MRRFNLIAVVVTLLLGLSAYWLIRQSISGIRRQTENHTQTSANIPSDPWQDVLSKIKVVPAPIITASSEFKNSATLNQDRWHIRIPGNEPGDQREIYNQQLLRLAMEKTISTHGPYKLELTEPLNRLRAFVDVAQGKLDVTWSVTTTLREQILLPIRIEIFRGLHGYRIFLIRKGEESRFKSIHNVDDLRRFTAGGGHDWQPTEVWDANQLPIVKSDNYQSLFTMLAHHRFDYFPRALFEPWVELATHPDLNLAVEDSVLVYFPTATYYFVNPARTDLAERIRAGLEHAIADGSFDQLFFSLPQFKTIVANAHLRQRTLIQLKNPFLPPTTLMSGSLFLYAPDQFIKHF